MKNSPGPLAPPDLRRPSLKMTARSYSFTTLMERLIYILKKGLEDLEAKPDADREGDEDKEVGASNNDGCKPAAFLEKFPVMIRTLFGFGNF